MSLKRCFLAVMALCALVLFSCQKNVSDIVPPAPGADSAVLLKSITSMNYDDQGRFVYFGRSVYDYSNAPQKIVLAGRDSSGPGYIYDYLETFQYDNSNRLSVFTSNFYREVSRIDFQYNANSELTKAILAYPDGSTLENTFKYQTVNGFKVIMIYDTANINWGGSERPRIVTYTFDDSNRIVKCLEASTYYNNNRQYWYLDTVAAVVEYDSQGNATKAKEYDSYFNGAVQVSSTDSAIYTRETRGTEIFNSSIAVCRNLYWFSLSESSPMFSDGTASDGNFAITPGLYTWKYPVKQIQHFSTGSAYQPSSTGLFQNTFNAAGQLTHAVYPAGFGSKYEGTSVFDYTYIKVKQ